MKDNATFSTTIEEDPVTGDLLLPFPPAFILKMGWTEDTELEWDITDDHHVILREKKNEPSEV